MFSWIAGLFTGGGSIAGTVLIYVFVYAAGAGSGAWATHKIDAASYEALVAANAQAVTKAVTEAKSIQAATDKVSLDAAVAEATAQQKIIAQHNATTMEITRYVKVGTPCVSYGLVRLLVSSGIGSDTSNLNTGPGKPNNACAPVDAVAFGTAIIDDFSNAKANAEQLNALEAWVAANQAASLGR